MKYIINGGKRLSGIIPISGNKNSLFPCVAAALLCQKQVIIENVPNIKDTEVLVEILKDIGVEVQRQDKKLIINAKKIGSVLSKELMMKLRGSIVLVGAILARNNSVSFYHPGGDVIGKRGIEAHLEGFRALGADYQQDDLSYKVVFKKIPVDKEIDIFLPERSVTATESLILVSSLKERVTILRNCASEPHVVDLCHMLSGMGVKIEGIGTDQIKIHGKLKLKGTNFVLREDYIEIGTYAIAAAITKGKITLTNLDNTDLDPILMPLKKIGVRAEVGDNKITFSADNLKAVDRLTTNVWPGFPTDLMSVFIVLATQAEGVSLCHDWMFESRMFFADKLMSMGANITIADPHRVLVYGPSHLRGREMESPDIRAGMAMVLAGLIATGTSVINKAELIERGYEDVVGKLGSLGADIKKEM